MTRPARARTRRPHTRTARIRATLGLKKPRRTRENPPRLAWVFFAGAVLAWYGVDTTDKSHADTVGALIITGLAVAMGKWEPALQRAYRKNRRR